MDLDHMKVFIDISLERSMTKGAKLNGVSQSAASQHIHDLERSLGTELLNRRMRPLGLTEAGELYLEFCRDVIRRKEQFDAEIGRWKRKIEGRVHLACIYSVGIAHMNQLEARFRKEHPEAELEIEYLRPEKVYEAVLAERTDLGLVSYPEARKEIKVIPWMDEVMVVAAPRDHPLSANMFLSAKQLDGVDFVAFDDDLPIARELRRFLRKHDVRVNVVMRFDNAVMIKEAVAIGSGISILPERAIREEVNQERLLAIPLESPGLYRPLGVIHHRRKHFNRAARALVDVLKRSAGR